jgi:uncharacterized protein YciI
MSAPPDPPDRRAGVEQPERETLKGRVVLFVVMDFLVYSRARAAGAAEDDARLDERHWSYMDTFADGMTARGPTLGADRQTWTGSLHVVELAGPKAAREFVLREPYNQAGLFEEHVVWYFENLLGRTMWQFAGAADEPRFLVLAQATKDRPRDPRPVPLADLAPQLREHLIIYGAMRDLDDGRPAGVALAVQVPTRDALDALLGDGLSELADYGEVGIHDWEFGGRR